MPNELASLLFNDIDDDVTQPRACLPTCLITIDDLYQHTLSYDLNEKHYHQLFKALDESLNP